MPNKPNIMVLMSVFNGEKYLKEQIESILNQDGVNIRILIRNDGSQDHSLTVLEEIAKKNIGKIKVINGENIGYKASFLYLLENAGDDADYYAFSDQDDVWQENKCKKAVDILEREMHDKVALYVSNVINTDEKLRILSKTNYAGKKFTLKSFFVRQRFAGCTYMFTNKLKRLSAKAAKLLQNSDNLPDHDFVVGSCAFYFGNVVVDPDSYIFHRRLTSSVTSGGKSAFKRIQVEKKIVFEKKYEQSNMAAVLIKLSEQYQEKERETDFLASVINSRQSMKARLRLCVWPGFSSQILVCDLETRAKILLGNY